MTKGDTPKNQKSSKEAEKARLAEALRANLRRRRDQAKKRSATENAGADAAAGNPPQSAATGEADD